MNVHVPFFVTKKTQWDTTEIFEHDTHAKGAYDKLNKHSNTTVPFELSQTKDFQGFLPPQLKLAAILYSLQTMFTLIICSKWQLSY